jgi:enolase
LAFTPFLCAGSSVSTAIKCGFIPVRCLGKNRFSTLSSLGRRDTLLEKPVSPPEPPEPVLHGSMAIGAVSLAVAKASATLASDPLYLTLASLKHDQVGQSCYIPAHGTWGQEHGGTRSCRSHSPLTLPAFQEQPSTFSMPLLMGSVLSCGKSSPGKLHLMKEVICIPSPGLTAKQVPDNG